VRVNLALARKVYAKNFQALNLRQQNNIKKNYQIDNWEFCLVDVTCIYTFFNDPKIRGVI
jgi:hypothetical protein